MGGPRDEWSALWADRETNGLRYGRAARQMEQVRA